MRPAIHIAALVAALAGAGQAAAQEVAYGTRDDIAYGAMVWDMIEARHLAGAKPVSAMPREGKAPHGEMLQTFYATGSIGDHTGDLIVTRSYAAEAGSADRILANPEEELTGYAVMFRREAGYDPENLDWFWARYAPDGSLARDAAGIGMVGRVGKGTGAGCIACHDKAAGDMVFSSDHLRVE